VTVGRSLVRFGLAVVAAWVVVVVLAALFQRQLVYLPDRSRPSPPAHVEAVVLRTADGLDLEAWYVPPAVNAASDATVLVAPGNAGNRALRLPLADGLAARGHAVLLLEYRGFGGNPGRPSEAGLLADARAARAHLDGRDDVVPGGVVYLGESLGTGVVAALAAERPPAAVVLRSPFPELADVGQAAYPFLPVRWLLRERYPVTDHLAEYAGPVLVVAGDADTIVPTALSRRVAAAVDAELTGVSGADHNDRALLDGDTYLDAVDAFVRAARDDDASDDGR
jgi:uncharacterized protein